MKMTPALLIIGALLVFWASSFIIVGIPALTMKETPSDIWRPWSAEEEAGHRLYVRNGCSYCHSLFVRTGDWDIGAERIAPGHYAVNESDAERDFGRGRRYGRPQKHKPEDMAAQS